jgi:hypothetical protein
MRFTADLRVGELLNFKLMLSETNHIIETTARVAWIAEV